MYFRIPNKNKYAYATKFWTAVLGTHVEIIGYAYYNVKFVKGYVLLVWKDTFYMLSNTTVHGFQLGCYGIVDFVLLYMGFMSKL